MKHNSIKSKNNKSISWYYDYVIDNVSDNSFNSIQSQFELTNRLFWNVIDPIKHHIHNTIY